MPHTLIDELEAEAIAQLGEVKKYRTYQGSNPEFRQKAKLAIGIIGSYVRLRATLANEETNRLVAARLEAAPPAAKQLKQ